MNGHLLNKTEKDFIFSPWTITGFLGSAIASYFGSGLLAPNAPRWWYQDSWPTPLAEREVFFYIGIFLLCFSWLAKALILRGLLSEKSGLKVALGAKAVWPVIVLWALPFILGPSLFSQDMYSYLAQGELWRLGQNPYTVPPTVLIIFRQLPLLHAVSPFWRNTTSPYGPLFVAISGYVYDLSGQNLTVAITLLRLVECAGMVMGGYFLLRMAGDKADSASLLWLGIGSPLVLLDLIAPGHNDALMIGLVILGVFLATKNRLGWAFFVLGIAVMVKAPAALAALLIAVCIARSNPPKWKEKIAAFVVMDGVLIGWLSFVLGVGLDWAGTNILNAPGKVHIATTLSTQFGVLFSDLFSRVSPYFAVDYMSSIFSKINLAIFVLLLLYFILRTRWDNLTTNLALVFLLSVLLGPATWPWYLTWGIVFLLLDKRALQSLATPVFIVVMSVLIKPNGILAIPSQYAPDVLALLLVSVVWYLARSRSVKKRMLSDAI